MIPVTSSCAPSKGQLTQQVQILSAKELITKLNKKLIGHYRYYGVSFNGKKITAFLHYTQRYLCKALNRRSQMKSYTWDGFIDMLKVYPLAKPKIYVRLF
ncbi:group II intron maturase-specific domain-containing protein [Blautia producta]|uniref:group II intron maturase-specific domain-containing protein n=1 Tax=Blautia producta TaxID=33035 RepID=UPI0035BE35C2